MTGADTKFYGASVSELFRDEVINRGLRDAGVPLGIARTWAGLSSVAITFIILVGIAVALFGEYSRKARVSGFLVPDRGILKIFPRNGGDITSRTVEEGQHVAEDDELFEIDVAKVTSAGRTPDLVLENLKQRRAHVEQELSRLQTVQKSEAGELEETVKAKIIEVDILERNLEIRGEGLRLFERALERSQALQNRDVYSIAQREKAEQDKVAASIQVIELERSLATAKGELAQGQARTQGLSSRQANDRSQLERLQGELDQQLLQLDDQSYQVVGAPAAGTITRLTATLGSTADPAVPLASLVPDGSRLEANLYVPSNAVGFVRIGTRVLLRYQAYPYQKFGLQEAAVSSISATSVSGRELPFPIPETEPVFLVTARLQKETITAFGREEPLQVGAKFDADLILESRKVWEYAIEPLLAARSNL
jgi:membrane fusion protein